MVNMQSPVIQSAMQNGANFGYPQQMNMGAGYNDFMNPPQPMYYQPQPMMQQTDPVGYYNSPYYVQQVATKPYDMLHYNQPGMMNMNGGYPINGYPPMYSSMPQYGYQPGGYPQYGKVNPLMGYQQQPPIQQKSFTIQGFNPLGSDKMMTTELIERLENINEKYTELNEQKMEERQSLYNDNPYNYYGYMNTSYMDPLLVSQYNRELREIEQEAVQARIAMNERLSKMVHYYLGDIDVDDEEQWNKVKQAYQTKVITIPESMSPVTQQGELFRSTIDVTEQNKERIRQANARVTAEHNRLVDPNSDMMDFFNNAGLILWQNAFDELQHQERLARRNKYSRRDFVKYLRGEGRKYDRNIDIPEGFEERENRYNPNDAFYSLFPNLKREDGWSYEDGVLKLNYPDRLKAQGGAVVNQEQSNYERQRLEFANAVYNKFDPRDPRYGGGIS